MQMMQMMAVVVVVPAAAAASAVVEAMKAGRDGEFARDKTNLIVSESVYLVYYYFTFWTYERYQNYVCLDDVVMSEEPRREVCPRSESIYCM